jgi:hypothetical protein
MSDPRTDPRQTDPRLDPVLRQSQSAGGMWGWAAGFAVLALIAVVLIAGWNSNSNTASNSPPPATIGNAPVRNVTPPSTTGSGTMSPQPATGPGG